MNDFRALETFFEVILEISLSIFNRGLNMIHECATSRVLEQWLSTTRVPFLLSMKVLSTLSVYIWVIIYQLSKNQLLITALKKI